MALKNRASIDGRAARVRNSFAASWQNHGRVPACRRRRQLTGW
jgi:hypothetical protein